MVLSAQSTTTDYIRAKTNFNLSPTYYAHKSSNRKFPQNHIISPDINLHKTKPTQIFEELIPAILPLLRKHIRLGHAGIIDHSVNSSIPDFSKV